MEGVDPSAKPALAATSWAILAILSIEDELSGYDVKKVTEWSIRYFYWSPSFSQIYTELKKLEKLGLATSRLDHDNGARSRRLYKITATPVQKWPNTARIVDGSGGLVTRASERSLCELIIGLHRYRL